MADNSIIITTDKDTYHKIIVRKPRDNNTRPLLQENENNVESDDPVPGPSGHSYGRERR